MDPSRSSYPHHATRYAAFPPPLQPPAPPYSDFYRPHRNTLHPPPPPPQFRPPPPPQPQHHHQPYLRPAPPLNSQNPQFIYNPNNVTRSPKPPIREDYNHPRDLPTRRIPEHVQHHNHHYVRETRPVFRVLSDDSPFPNSKLDQREAYHRQIEKFGFRNEYEGVELRKRDEVDDYHRSRSQFGPSRDFRVPATQVGSVSRSLEMDSGGYEARRELAYDGGESVRDMRELLIERGSNEVADDGDGIVRVFGVKRDLYRSREGNVEFEKHSSRGSREGSHEYNRTPRKQMQKKSALFRIQKPSYRNREDDRMHHSVYYDDGKSSSFRGSKDQNDGKSSRGSREGSPVQLDVSFKSNSLVAKAIVTPTSSNTAISDVKLEDRSSKVRKVLVFDKEGTSKSHAKRSEDNVKLDKSVSVRNASSRSYKDSKDSKERVSASGKGSACVTSSSSGSGGKNGLPLNGRLKSVIEKGGSNVALPKIAKKKKVVNKVVKKVSNPNLSSSTSQSVEKSDTNVKADRFLCGNPTTPQADKATAVVTDIVSYNNSSSSTSQPIEKSDANVKADWLPCGKPTSSC